MTFFSLLSEWFWNPNVWLPPGINWEDVQSNDNVKHTDFVALLYPIPAAIGIILTRFIVERTILVPWGERLGLRKSSKAVPPSPYNTELENAYRKSRGKLDSREIGVLAKRTDLDVRQIERWLRQRSVKDKLSKLAKFSESGWRCICYITSVVFGLVVLWNTPWFSDIKHCWYDYPHHTVTDGVWWYYVYGAGIYWSLLITQAFDAKRKDFWEMFVHHWLTIGLLAFSWTCNFTRIGTLILLLHDCADVFLEAGKMCKYAKYDRLCDVIFVLFTVVWLVTRLGVYPFRILRSTLVDAPEILNMFPAYYFFNGMLVMLLGLHIFWTYFLFKAIGKVLTSGQINDQRSSTEASDSEYSDKDFDSTKTSTAHKV